MTSKYIKRKWTDHAQSTEYLSDEDEYIKLEIFSFDPEYTKTFSVEAGTLKGENVNRTSFESLIVYNSKDMINPMEFTLDYNVHTAGEYRVDVLYMKNTHMYTDKDFNTSKDLTGWYDIYRKDSKQEHKAQVLTSLPSNAPKAMKELFKSVTVKAELREANNSNTNSPNSSVNLKFEGENNCLKRKTLFKQLTEGDWKFEFAVPHNCYIVGAIIRKIIYYSGSNNDEPGSNLQFTEAKLTNSDMSKPVELECTIGYDDSFECPSHRSGLFMEHMDECNLYVKTTDDKIKQIFGGYIATPLQDKDIREITIHASDRLRDGENKYILDQLEMQSGDGSSIDYSTNNIIRFNRYSDVLKYLCRLYECTLNHNITSNFKVDVEKYQDSFIIGFGSKRDVKKVTVSNGTVKVNSNSVVLRNNANSSKKQVFTLYAPKKPVNLSKYGNDEHPVNLHIHYGLGDVKTSHKVKETVKADVSESVAGSQKFNKCGVSSDKKYVMGIGMRGVGKSAKTYPYGTYYQSIFKNKCPYCGNATLRWDSCRSDSNCIRGGTKKNFPVPAKETEITCTHCDCDFDVPTGYSKEGKYKYKLTKVGNTKKSSKSEQDKLHKGQMVAVPSSKVNVTADDIFKAIKNACKGWTHSTGTGTTASYLEKHHVGDCWAWSDWISKQLKKYKVNNKIMEYKSSGSNQHRSVLYQNSKCEYVDFPYKKYGFPKGTYNTAGSTKGRKVGSYTAGGRINQASTTSSTSKTQTTEVTITEGYDKDTPFQAYLDICFTFQEESKKHHVYVDFTQKSKSNYSISGLNPVWVNNASSEITLKGILNKIKDFYKSNKYAKNNVYLHSLSFITPKVPVSQGEKNSQWYTNDDNTRDNSSCKIILYSISFDNQTGIDEPDLHACGKTINEVMKSTIESADYILHMDYGVHRVNDKINFQLNQNDKALYTATEGDDNNILDWNNISYDPANEMFNMSRCVFKQRDKDTYAYVSTKDINSILEFQEHCTLITENEAIGSKEAYWNARHNENFNPSIVYNYTITVKGVPDLNLMDLVNVVSDAKQLNTLKEVESFVLNYSISDKPVLQTELGLGELAPDIQVTENIRKLRDNAKKANTYFFKGASPINDLDVYEWEY